MNPQLFVHNIYQVTLVKEEAMREKRKRKGEIRFKKWRRRRQKKGGGREKRRERKRGRKNIESEGKEKGDRKMAQEEIHVKEWL